jgi:hypothetical protein
MCGGEFQQTPGLFHRASLVVKVSRHGWRPYTSNSIRDIGWCSTSPPGDIKHPRRDLGFSPGDDAEAFACLADPRLFDRLLPLFARWSLLALTLPRHLW